jgi:hypothetical protein
LLLLTMKLSSFPGILCRIKLKIWRKVEVAKRILMPLVSLLSWNQRFFLKKQSLHLVMISSERPFLVQRMKPSNWLIRVHKETLGMGGLKERQIPILCLIWGDWLRGLHDMDRSFLQRHTTSMLGACCIFFLVLWADHEKQGYLIVVRSSKSYFAYSFFLIMYHFICTYTSIGEKILLYSGAMLNVIFICQLANHVKVLYIMEWKEIS